MIILKAYQTWSQANKNIDKKLPGLAKYTGEQLFFMNFGNVWCGKINNKMNMFNPKEIIIGSSQNPTEEMKSLFGYKDFFKLKEKVGIHHGGVYLYYEHEDVKGSIEGLIMSDRPKEGITDLVKSIYPKAHYSNNLQIIKDKYNNDWANYGFSGGGAYYKLPPVDTII